VGTVTFERLVVRGLGLYGGEAVFEFSPGSNVLLGCNESGKSTMAEGLCGVLFGLRAPALQSRHWGGSRAFAGELWIKSGGVHFHIKRSFATNSIEVMRLDPTGKWLRTIMGLHKPEAHKPNKPYLEFLRTTFGVTSRETFRGIYYVAQPLPEGNALDAKVQELISGGGTRHHSAREALQENLKKVTRNWKAYAPSLGSGTKDRELEKVQVERRELALSLVDHSSATEELRQVDEKLSQLLFELSAVKARVAAQDGIQVAWQQWSMRRDKYVASRERARKIDASSAAAEDLSQATATSTKALAAREFPRLRQIEAERTLALMRVAEFKLFTPLGEHAVEHVRAVRRFVEERSTQLADVEQDLSQAVENELQVEKSEIELHAAAEKYERKYGASPKMVSLQDFATLSARQDLLDKKSRQEDRLRAALSRPRATPWPALAGGVAGAVVYLVLEGQVGIGAAVLLLALGIATSFLWRGQDPAARIYQAELAETELALAKQGKVSTFSGEQSSELWLAAKQDFLLYQEGERAVSERKQVAAERVRYLYGRSSEFRRRLDSLLSNGNDEGARGLPRYFVDVCALLRINPQGQSLTAVLGDLQRAPWDEVERQANAYAGAGNTLLRCERDLVEALKEAQQEIESQQDRLSYILVNENVADVQALSMRRKDIATDLLLARQEWQAVVDQYPGLPSLDQTDDVLGIDQAKKDLARQLELARTQVDSLERDIFSLRNRQGYLVGQRTENLAQGEEALADFLAREQLLTREARILGMAITGLKNAAEEFHTATRELVAERATYHFTAITGRGRQVRLDEEFNVYLVAEQGNKITPAELSQGTEDQLYISLRLAMSDLVGGERVIPLLFDDPFLTADGERLPKLRQALEHSGRQSILLSHSEIFRDWGVPVVVTRQDV